MATMAALVEERNKLAAKQAVLAKVFAEAGETIDLSKVTSLDGNESEKAAKIGQLNTELGDIGKRVTELMAVENASKAVAEAERFLREPAKGFRHPAAGSSADRDEEERHTFKSVGRLFSESAAFKDFRKTRGPSATLDISLKDVMSTTDGWPPQSLRTGLVVPFATQPIKVIDILTQIPTTYNAVKYMEETTYVNAGVETTEAFNYPEGTLKFTERSVPVQKIAVFIPVTEEQMEDVQGIEAYINQRLTFMLRQRADREVLQGDGVSPNLTGVLHATNLQTQAKGVDPTPDALHKAITLVRSVGFTDPTHCIMHPTDWEQVALLRSSTGFYLFGNPWAPQIDTIWGLPVIQTTAIPLNTAVLGDFTNFCAMYNRTGIEVEVSNSHGDFFIQGKLAIRADVRLAFVVTRGAAFCQITGV